MNTNTLIVLVGALLIPAVVFLMWKLFPAKPLPAPAPAGLLTAAPAPAPRLTFLKVVLAVCVGNLFTGILAALVYFLATAR